MRRFSDDSDDDYEKIARTARGEAKRALKSGKRLAVRQASEKTYLAAVEMARSIVRRDGGTEEPAKRSSSAIGQAMNRLTAKKYGPVAKEVTSAMSRAVVQHTSCFYDGLCNAKVTLEVANDLLRAAKRTKRIKIHP